MEDHKERRAKQEITIPFVWEERPGTPKKDWKPMAKPLSPVARPFTYVASVPFKWEEKPGTPLQCLVTEHNDQPRVIPEPVLENRRLPLPPAFFANIEYYDSDEDENDGEDEDSFDDEDYDDDVDPDWTSLWGSEAQTEESISATAVVPLQNPFVNGSPVDHTPPLGSPESCTSPSNNYATGNNATSLRGATFLEYLFPMIPPKSEEKLPVPKREPLGLDENSKKLDGVCRQSGAMRRPLTLQELIMLSRRRSNRRKALYMKKQNPEKAFTNKRAHGCFSFTPSGGRITTQLGKDLLALKLA